MSRKSNSKHPRRASNRRKLKPRLRVAKAKRNSLRRKMAHRRRFV